MANDQPRKPDIDAIFDDPAAVNDVLREATRQALLRHKKLGQSVAVWRDGKVVILRPEEIDVEDDAPGGGEGK